MINKIQGKKKNHLLGLDNWRRRNRRAGSSSNKESHSWSTFNSKLWPHKHKQSNMLVSKQIALIMENTSHLTLLLETQTVSNNSIKNSYPGPDSSENLSFQSLPPKLHHAQSRSSSLSGSALPRTRIRKQFPSQRPTAQTRWRLHIPLSPCSAFPFAVEVFFLIKSNFGNLHLRSESITHPSRIPSPLLKSLLLHPLSPQLLESVKSHFCKCTLEEQD